MYSHVERGDQAQAQTLPAAEVLVFEPGEKPLPNVLRRRTGAQSVSSGKTPLPYTKSDINILTTY